MRVGTAGVFLFFVCMINPGLAVSAEKSDFQFRKQPEIQQVRPAKPVKIKVHRNAKGEYSWDLSGDSADEIAEIDKKLRKLLKVQ